MSKEFEKNLINISQAIDDLVSLDLAGLGVSKELHRILKKAQPESMCLGAARMLNDAAKGSRKPVFITTGFPMGGGVPETDGPVGAAALARAVVIGFGAPVIIATDKGWEAPLKAACIGMGLAPREMKDLAIPEASYLTQVHILSLPKEDNACRRLSDAILQELTPSILVAIERPGKNHCGAYHGMNGRPLQGLVADMDYLFAKAKDLGLPTLAVGDGGNELGMGVIEQGLCELLPQAKACGCGCGGGSAAAFAADHLVCAVVSNFGATGIVAALAALLRRLDLLHTPEMEERAIRLCADAGAVDGVSLGPNLAVDGIPSAEWAGALLCLHGIIKRGLGLNGDWRRKLN